MTALSNQQDLLAIAPGLMQIKTDGSRSQIADRHEASQIPVS